MTKRLLRLVALAAIASAIGSAIKAARRPGTSGATDEETATGADAWPEVPRNPAST